MKWVKERVSGIVGSVSGGASLMGSWQVCHNVCLGLLVALSSIGITVVGMPLAFLTELSLPLWLLAVGLFAVTGIMYLKKKCLSPALLMVNAGLILAGTPFIQTTAFVAIFWIGGGLLVAGGIAFWVRRRTCHTH